MTDRTSRLTSPPSQVIGYYGRAQTIKSPALNPFIISTLCIILAPILLAVVKCAAEPMRATARVLTPYPATTSPAS